jgi:hypothetical protein
MTLFLAFLPNLQMGGSEGDGALAHTALKSLTMQISSGFGLTLSPSGNTLSIDVVDTVPTVAPPNNKGVVFHIAGATLTVYAWDGAAWRS